MILYICPPTSIFKESIHKPNINTHQPPLIPLHNLPKLNHNTRRQRPHLLCGILLVSPRNSRHPIKHITSPIAQLEDLRRELRNETLFPRRPGRDVQVDDAEEESQ